VNEVNEATNLAGTLERRRQRRTRHRLASWGAFLLVGLLLGTVYATGFAEVGGETGAESEAAAFNNDPAGGEEASDLAGLISVPGGEDLAYDWFGHWGRVESKVMFELDLTSLAAGDAFYSEVVLANEPSGFSALQLQLRVAKAAGTSCSVSDLSGTAASNYRVMSFDTADAQVTFAGLAGATGGLPGGARYCIGVVDYAGPPRSGRDTGGTFIRKAERGRKFSGAYPRFVASLNRIS
jgi:hypothetical protein